MYLLYDNVLKLTILRYGSMIVGSILVDVEKQCRCDYIFLIVIIIIYYNFLFFPFIFLSFFLSLRGEPLKHLHIKRYFNCLEQD